MEVSNKFEIMGVNIPYVNELKEKIKEAIKWIKNKEKELVQHFKDCDCLKMLEDVKEFILNTYEKIVALTEPYKALLDKYLEKMKHLVHVLIQKILEIIGLYKLASLYDADYYVGKLNFFHLISRAWFNLEYLPRINNTYPHEKLTPLEDLKAEVSILKALANYHTESEQEQWTENFYYEIQEPWAEIVEKIAQKKETLHDINDVFMRAISKCMNTMLHEDLAAAFYDVWMKEEHEHKEFSEEDYIKSVELYLGVIWKDEFIKACHIFYQFSLVDVPTLSGEMLCSYAEQKSLVVALKRSLENIAYKVIDLALNTYDKVIDHFFQERDREYALEHDPAFKELEKYKTRLQQLSYLNHKIMAMTSCESLRALAWVQSTKQYQWADKYIKFEEKYGWMRDQLINAKNILETNLFPIYEKIIVFLQDGYKKFTLYVELSKKEIAKIKDLLYSKLEGLVKITEDYWLKLDFDLDGEVTYHDLVLIAKRLWEILTENKYIEETRAKASLVYQKALTYIKREEKAPSKIVEPKEKVSEVGESGVIVN